VLLGRQEPRVRLEPRRSEKWTDGDDACFLAASYGLTPDPWQALVITSWLGRRPDGRLAAGRCGLAVPRQNGKNGVLEVVELFKMVVLGRRILHTAHEIKTARKAFVRIRSFFENERQWPELAALVLDVRQTNGQEAIVLRNGGSIEFVARSRGSGRGFTVDDLVLDEAQELTDEQLEALLPTISAAPSGDPQIIQTGTPPPPNADGAPFKRMRAAGVDGKDRRLSWHEWSPARVPDLADHEALMALAAETNPALGTRLQASVVEDELAQMSFAGWLRERCGAWDSDAIGGALNLAAWNDLAISADNAPRTGPIAFAVKFSSDGERVACAVARLPEGGPVHVEALGVSAMADGTAALVEWLAQRWRKASLILIDGKAGAGDLMAELVAAGVSKRRVREATTPDVFAANAGMLRAIHEGDLTHLGQPGLDASVRVAGKKVYTQSGGWVWISATPEGDVTALIAATLARHAVMTSRRRQASGEGRSSGNRTASSGRRAVVS
jgi:hypothetical protein